MNLEMEHAGKTVSPVTGVLLSRSATPWYSTVIIPAAFFRAHPIPGKFPHTVLYSMATPPFVRTEFI
jgi:hypothetical protein